MDPDLRSITYAYDGDTSRTRTTQYNADSSVADVLTFTYDANGNMLTATDDAGTVTMTYNGDQLVTRTDPFGKTLTYGYDSAGNVVSEADSLGGVTTTTYDGNQMMTKSYVDSTTHLVSDFTYDGDGNLLTVSRYAVVSDTPVLAAATVYAYDGGQVTSIVSEDASSDVLQSDVYTYDPAGRVASATVNGVETDYSYDATGQLTSDSVDRTTPTTPTATAPSRAT